MAFFTPDKLKIFGFDAVQIGPFDRDGEGSKQV